MKIQTDYTEIFEQASQMLNCDIQDLEFYSWYKLFSTTAGPHILTKDMVAGQAFTNFQILGFINKRNRDSVKYCDGVWKLEYFTIGDIF